MVGIGGVSLSSDDKFKELHTQPEFITDNEITYCSLDETILFSSSGEKVF